MTATCRHTSPPSLLSSVTANCRFDIYIKSIGGGQPSLLPEGGTPGANLAQLLDHGIGEISIGVEEHSRSLHEPLFAFLILPDRAVDLLGMGGGVFPGGFEVREGQTPKAIRVSMIVNEPPRIQ